MYVFGAAFLSSLCLVSGLLLRYAPFAPLTTRKQRRTLLGIYVLTLIINSVILYVAIDTEATTNVFVRYNGVCIAFITALANIFIVRGRTREHLFVFGVVLTCNYLLLSIPAFIGSVISGISAAQSYILTELIYVALLLLTYVPMRVLLRNTVEPFLSFDSGDYWKTVWFIPIALFLAMFIDMMEGDSTDSVYYLSSRATTAAVLILMCLTIAADHKRLREKQVLDEQLLRQKLHYGELRAKMEDARKARHDMKHHIAVIRHYIDTDDKEGLRVYCNDLIGEAETEAQIPYTGNAAADGMMYHYIKLAEQNQIRFDYSGTIHSRSIADTDLCALLGNALDNALAGCMTIDRGRSIRVISQSEKNLLSIVISNPFDGEVKQSRDKILSRKRENRAGVGLASMKSICERYGGSMQTQWDENSFTVMFMLPLKNES